MQKMTFSRNLAIALLAATLTACGHKTSNPVALSQPGDNALTCSQLEERMANNRAAANRLAGKDAERESTNTAAVAVSAIVFWPAVFAVDLSNKEQIEMRALRDRNRNLARLHKKQQCEAQ